MHCPMCGTEAKCQAGWSDRDDPQSGEWKGIWSFARERTCLSCGETFDTSEVWTAEVWDLIMHRQVVRAAEQQLEQLSGELQELRDLIADLGTSRGDTEVAREARIRISSLFN